MWILPLIIYLVTFILCFEGRGWYQRVFFLGPLGVILVVMAWGLNAGGEIMEVTHAVPIYCAGLFVCCMFYHGELAALKPAARYLTRFYLMVSLGGALGGLFVGVAAPLVFSTYYEFGIGLVVSGLLALYLLWPLPKWIPAAALGVTIASIYYVHEYVDMLSRNTQVMARNFYGTLRVKQTGPDDEPTTVRRMMHGVIMHGEQYLDPNLKRKPTSYYGPDAGIGIAIRHYANQPLKLGVVGLGTGTLAAWGKEDDVFRFYELDPQVLAVAQRNFTYLSDTKARIETALGDARLNLEREPNQQFDILVIDAFSSDAIPAHLITREALAVYLRHMKPNGIIAFHVTNRYLDLPPVVKGLADAAGIPSVLVSHDPDEKDERYSRTDWMLLSRDKAFLESDPVKRAAAEVTVPAGLGIWTDDFNNLLRILK
jgi:SAM-dependent methyltransferase